MNASIPLNSHFPTKTRFASVSNEPVALADIYKEDINIAVWQRQLLPGISQVVEQLLAADPHFQLSVSTRPEKVRDHLQNELSKALKDDNARKLLVDDIADTVDMFCCLFELSATGLRLTGLDRAMCPRFHVDRVPARLVTTYNGIATEWLPHQSVDRSKLGTGSKGMPDHQSGLYQDEQDIQQLGCGDVALLKGELWEGNEHAGLVHRSPSLKAQQNRLLLTLDFIN